MDDSQVAWHKDQADAICAYEQSIRIGEVELAQRWWAVGEWLNHIYGINTTGKTNKETEIPLMDLSTLADIYKISSNQGVRRAMNRARRFHRMAPSEEQRDAAIKEYGSWTKIHELFCTGQPSHVIVHHNSNAHMMNVPDIVLNQVIARLGSAMEARKAIRFYMQVMNPDNIVNVYLQTTQPYDLTAVK